MSGFLQHVQAEMMRMDPASGAPAEAEPAQPEDGRAEKLREDIAKISVKIDRIAELDRDPALEAVLQQYKAQRTQLQAQLTELKPLAARITKASKDRDEAVATCATLRREMEAMQRCLTAKQQALQEASALADKKQGELDALIQEQRVANAEMAAPAPSARTHAVGEPG